MRSPPLNIDASSGSRLIDGLDARPSLARSLLSLLGGFGAMLGVGTVYGWGVIAQGLPEYGYSPGDVLLIGTAGSFSIYVTFHLGFFFDRCGARATLCLGGALTVSGWLLTSWGITRGHPAELVAFYQVICGQGVQPTMAACLENVRNFPPARRGAANAVLITGFGLTSVLMAQVRKRLFQTDLPGFLLCLACSAGALSALQLVLFATVPPDRRGSAQATTENAGSTSKHLWSLLQRAETRMFVFIMICFGMNVYLFNVNLAEFNAIAHGKHEPGDLVLVFGLCNVVTRLVVGLSSDLVPMSRAQLMCMGFALCAVAEGTLAVQHIMVGAALMGATEGFMFALWVPLTREIHGDENYGTTLSLYLFTLGFGDLFINFIIGKTVLPPVTILRLFGREMFASAMLVCVLMVLSSIISLYLHRRLAKGVELEN